MAKSPEEIEVGMIANLPNTTGKALEAWIKHLGGRPVAKHGDIVKYLKAEHGLGHGYANLIAHKFLSAGRPAAEGEDLVAAQYAGAKTGLRPIYDALIAAIQKFGSDVEVSPKKTYVSLRRSKQFALIQPSTATRVDVGVQLKGEKPAGRLEASGSFNAMVTHRIRVESARDVDSQLIGWLKRAYESA